VTGATIVGANIVGAETVGAVVTVMGATDAALTLDFFCLTSWRGMLSSPD